MLEIGGLLAVLELGAFLDQQFDKLRIGGKEIQRGSDGAGDLIERVRRVGHGRIDGLPQALQDTVHRGQEQLALGAEIAIQRALAHAKAVGEDLGIRLGVAALGEKHGGRLEDFLTAPSTQVHIGRTSRFLQLHAVSTAAGRPGRPP